MQRLGLRTLMSIGRVRVLRTYSNLSPAVSSTPSPAAPAAQTQRNNVMAMDLPSQYLSSEHIHAWGLLEACIQSGNLERAEFVLLGYAKISNETGDITLAVNNYLIKLVELNPNDPSVAKSWLNRISFLLKEKFKKNSLTDAVLLKNAYLAGSLEPFLKLNSSALSAVLNHVEVLGVATVQAIIKAGNIDSKLLDSKVRDLLSIKDKQTQSTDTIVGLGKMPEAVPKGSYEELLATESVGLRSIRHVLSGLNVLPEEKTELSNIMHPLIQGKQNDYLDFFQMSKKITNEEDRAKFEQSMDSINERRQQLIETRGVEAARMKWKEAFDRLLEIERKGEAKLEMKGIEMMLWQWNQLMQPLVNEEIEKIKELMQYHHKTSIPLAIRRKQGKSYSDRFDYGPFFLLAVPENLPAITMMSLVRLNSTKGVADGIKSIKAVIDVGKNVELDYRLRALKQKENEVLKEAGTGETVKRQRKAVSSLRHKIRKTSLDNSNAWPNYIHAKIGSVLIAMLLQEAKVTVYGNDPVSGKQVKGEAPAFQHTYQYQGGNKVGVLKPHKVVAGYLTGENTASAIQPQFLPMLVEPRPWSDWDSGGYYYTRSKIVRSRNSPEQVAYVREAAKRGQIDKVYRGLNVLGRTPWTINAEMFRLISKIWNSGEGMLDIPPAVKPTLDKSELPEEPDRDADPRERRDYMRLVRRKTLENGAIYSQRCDLNYKLDVARAFLGERFYMPHNLDFRGRAYPLSPHLTHLGNDVSRSLLMFWKGRELGPDGLRWLKIHISNLFGHSKLSFDERVAFVEENMESCRASMEDPLNNKWWQQADDPFQALAAISDMCRAIDSGNPETWVSHIPVHMDGSCNGLQHYAALGGDVEGAHEVNLVDMERPQDVYTRVLEIVKVDIEKLAKEGNPAAQILYPYLSRKVVKQTVMTHVYGVTFIGAREQIANRLKEIDGFPQDKVFAYSGFLANLVLNAVRKLFSSAHEIQDWLGEVAMRVSNSITIQPDVEYDPKKEPNYLSSVIWTTPVGLPIVQPYRQHKRKQIVTELQSVYLHDPYSLQGVNSRKQKTAFPPNYVHSLDATHMLLSAIECEAANIAFASVHDSYWTHAGDINTLNAALRRTFVDLYKRDHIGRLRQEFIQRYKDLVQVCYIPSDSELAKKVEAAWKNWTRSNGRSPLHQTVIEIQRMEKLASGEDVPESPLSIVNEVPEAELEALITQGSDLRKQKTARATSKSVPKSTEHQGSGLDIFDQQDTQEEDVPVEVLGKVMRVLVPLRIPAVPDRGEFDVENVLTSPYFFS